MRRAHEVREVGDGRWRAAKCIVELPIVCCCCRHRLRSNAPETGQQPNTMGSISQVERKRFAGQRRHLRGGGSEGRLTCLEAAVWRVLGRFGRGGLDATHLFWSSDLDTFSSCKGRSSYCCWLPGVRSCFQSLRSLLMLGGCQQQQHPPDPTKGGDFLAWGEQVVFALEEGVAPVRSVHWSRRRLPFFAGIAHAAPQTKGGGRVGRECGRWPRQEQEEKGYENRPHEKR